MRALLSLCLPLLALAGTGCSSTAAARAPSRTPVPLASAATDTPARSTTARPQPTAASSRDLAAGVLASPQRIAESAPPDPTGEVDGEVHGTIVARQGSRLTIRLDDDTPIAAGDRAQLLRHFERRLGSATLTGWLDVARVTVLARDGHSFDLSIDEETARVMVNGRKQDQFRVGFRVRLQAT
jgi:hypothetical protein